MFSPTLLVSRVRDLQRTFSNIMIKTLSKYLPGAGSAEAPPTSTAQVVARMESIGAILGVGGSTATLGPTGLTTHATGRAGGGTGRRTRDPGVRRPLGSEGVRRPLASEGDRVD